MIITDDQTAIVEYFATMRLLAEKCNNEKQPNNCHLEYFKGMRIGTKLRDIIEEEMKPFIKENKKTR